jgi:ribosomal protein L37AE/L43A
MSDTTPEKPVCPTCPSAAVLNARSPVSDRRSWVCVKCGAALGVAPDTDTMEWEKQVIGEKKP